MGLSHLCLLFFFNDTATTEIYTLSLHDALPLADVAAAEAVVQHRRLEPLPVALLAGGGDTGHHGQVGEDDTGAVAVGAGALGVCAEKPRLHAAHPRERLADRLEQPGVRGRIAAPGAADRSLVDRH